MRPSHFSVRLSLFRERLSITLHHVTVQITQHIALMSPVSSPRKKSGEGLEPWNKVAEDYERKVAASAAHSCANPDL